MLNGHDSSEFFLGPSRSQPFIYTTTYHNNSTMRFAACDLLMVVIEYIKSIYFRETKRLLSLLFEIMEMIY